MRIDLEDKKYIENGLLVDNDRDFSSTIKEDVKELVHINDSNLNDYIQKYIYPMSLEQILSYIDVEYTDSVERGPSFIMPNGKFLSVGRNYNDWDKDEWLIHDYVLLDICDKIFEDRIGYDNLDTDYSYSDEMAEIFTDRYGVIRINTGEFASEDRFYCVLPDRSMKRPTFEQYFALRKFFDYGVEHGQKEVLVFFSIGFGKSHTYSLIEDTSDDIIKKIRRYYATGEIVEKYYPQPNKLYNIENDEATWPEDAEDFIYWHSEADKWADEYAKSYKVKMSPKDFLDLTTTNGADSLKVGDELGLGELRELDIDEFNKETYQNIFLQIAFRDENHPQRAQVVGHEGRHRMFALMQAGVKSVDVELIADVYNTEYNKYKPYQYEWIQLVGQFNKSVIVQVYNPIAMSWKQHKSIRPNLKDEELKEYLERVQVDDSSEYPVFATDDIYRLKAMLQKADAPYRIYNDDETYYFQNALGNKTHLDMLNQAKENGWLANSKLREPVYDDGDDLTAGEIYPEDYDEGYMVFIPKNFSGNLRWHTRLGDDSYYDCRVYDFGVMFTRSSEAYNNGLFKALGKPEKEIYYDSWDDKVSVNSGNNTRDFDVYLELEGDPNKAVSDDVMSMRPRAEAEASRDAKMAEFGIPEKLWGQTGQALYWLVKNFIDSGYTDTAFINKEDAKAIINYLNKMNFSDVPKIEIQESLNEGIADVKIHYPKISDNDFNAIIKADPTFVEGKDKVGTYGRWLLTLFSKGSLKLEDLYKATEYLTEFENKKKLFSNKDIGQFKSLPDLFDALQNVGDVELSDNQKQKQFHKELKKTQLNADVVLDTDKWVVYIPKDYESSCKLSSNTEWCTGISSKGDDYYYKYYTSQGPLYIIHNKQNEDEKYQFHFPSSQFMDKTDRNIDLTSFLNKEKELKNYFYPLVLSPYYKDLGITSETDDNEVVSYTMSYDALDYAMQDVKGDRDRSPSGEWVMKFLEDPFSAYDFYSEGVDISDILRYLDIDEKIFEKLKKLGCTAGSIKEFTDKAVADNSLEELLPEDIYEDVEIAFVRAYDEGNYTGTINACENDIISAFNSVFEPLTSHFMLEEGLKVTGTKKQWEDLIMQIKSDYDDDYDNITNVSEVLSKGIAEWFEVREPRYGWNGFDDEAFLSRLDDELSEIEYSKTESLSKHINEKYAKSYYRYTVNDENNNYLGGLFRAGIEDKLHHDDNNEIVKIIRKLADDHQKIRDARVYKNGDIVKFAFTQSFVDKHKEDFETLEKLLKKQLKYNLVKIEVNSEDIKVLFRDDNQIAYISNNPKIVKKEREEAHKKYLQFLQSVEKVEEEIKNGKLIVYRVGQVDDFKQGLFFADSLDYFDYSDTGYSREDAEAYELDLSNAKIFDPMKEWNLSVNTWSDIRQEEEFFKEKNYSYYEYLDEVDYDDVNEYHEVMTDTYYLAQYAYEEGYDVCILRDIPGDGGRSSEQTEYCVFNKNIVKKVLTNENLNSIIVEDKKGVSTMSTTEYKNIMKKMSNDMTEKELLEAEEFYKNKKESLRESASDAKLFRKYHRLECWASRVLSNKYYHEYDNELLESSCDEKSRTIKSMDNMEIHSA